MTKNKYILAFLALIALAIIGPLLYHKVFKTKQELPFVTQKPQRKTIAKVIDATGKISIVEKIKIGSLVTGIIKKLYVDENETVTKGQLLAEIDTGKDDADVRKAEGELQKAHATLTYQKQYLQRQEELYKTGQLARDLFEQIARDTAKAQGDVLAAQATYDKATQEFANTKIYAPQDGIVISVGIAQGERVTTDLNATVLFEIAKDITKMEATLEIDESDVGLIKQGQRVSFTIDSVPHKTFKTTITELGYSPKKKDGNMFYKAIIPINNSDQLLRPGLSVNAKIFIAKAKEVLTIPAQAFMISAAVLEEIAKTFNFSYQKTDHQVLKNQQKISGEQIKTVWVVDTNGAGNSFVEKIIKTNITDDIFFEVVQGLTEQDNVIVDITETSHMEEILKKAFRSNF